MKMDSKFVNNSELLMRDMESLDLKVIKMKLQDEKIGEGWSIEFCDIIENEYKRFLSLKRKYPEKHIIPNNLIDKFWSQHILETEKYTKDCQRLFGYFLHHYPCSEMDAKQNERTVKEIFEDTNLIYKKHFGEDYFGFAKE